MSKLPINCFNCVTNYAKANWMHDSAPEKETKWTQWSGLDGYKNIVVEYKGNTTKFSWKEGTPRTDWTYWLATAVYMGESDYKGYVPVFHGKFVSRDTMYKTGWNPKDNDLKVSASPNGTQGLYLNAILIDYVNLDAYWIPNEQLLSICKAQKGAKFDWFAIGDTKQINSSMFEYFEITMVPLEWVNANAKTVIREVPTGCRQIQAGDRLGLVYWDGTPTYAYGASLQISTDKLSPSGVPYKWLTCRKETDEGKLVLYDESGGTYGPTLLLLEKAGTIDLSEYNLSVVMIERNTQRFVVDHLFHVI